MKRRSASVAACLVGVVVFTAGCGGDDDADAPAAAEQISESGESGGDDGDQSDDGEDGQADSEGDSADGGQGEGDPGEDDAGESDGDPGDDEGDESDADAAGGDLTCADIFSMTEMEEWFAEPVEFTEDTTPSIGQLVCTWASIEDPEDLDDLAFSLLTAQVFTGDPIPASNFIDPDVFDEVTMIDGVGDLAFYEESFGRGYYVLDEPIAGTFSYSEVNMGDADAEPTRTAVELDELFRLFHERISR